MSTRFPGESPAYRAARDRLLAAEAELRRALERVAEQRRALPPGGPVTAGYAFDSQDGEVAIEDLFGDHDALVLYSFMYSQDMARPCPSCTSIVDSLDGAAPHLSQRVGLAVVAKSPLPRLRAFAAERGWRNVRLLSSAGGTYNRDYLAERADGGQMPMLNVFTRDEGGAVRHFWGSELLYAPSEPGQEPRHVDLIWPIWSVLDATPGGRGTSWEPRLSYEEEATAAPTGPSTRST